MKPEENFKLSVEALQEAARSSNDHDNWHDYTAAQNNLAVIYKELAARGIKPEENLKLSVEALQNAARHRNNK